MALPKLNQTPSYELTVPSTQEKIKFRPFLVKEQKILLMALETQDEKHILQSIYNTLQVCILSECNINNLAIFDVEYIFLQMRGKSVGESLDLKLKCHSSTCEHEQVIKIALDDIKIEILEQEKTVNINDEYTLNLKYPTFNDILNSPVDTKETTAAPEISDIYTLSLNCLESLDTAEEKFIFNDETHESKEEFLGSLTSPQFENIMKFVEALPKLKHNFYFDCEKCNENNNYNIQGLQDFF